MGMDEHGPMDGHLTNTTQAEHWAGPAGARWIDDAERHDRMLAPYSAAVVGAAELSATDTVLDVGCGTGALTRSAARLAVDGQVTGVDISARMITTAREITDAEGPGNARFEEADAQVHRFPADGFDTLVSRFGVMFFGDPVAAFANLHGAVRPGGRVAVACWRELGDNEWLRVPRAAAAEQFGMPEPAPPGEPGPFSLADPDKVRQVLADAGFDRVELAAVGGPMWIGSDVDDAASFLAGLETSRRMFDGQEPAAVAQVLAAVRDALAAHAGPHGVVLSGKAWVVTARA
jgi:SAM-dependent methyltransferase